MTDLTPPTTYTTDTTDTTADRYTALADGLDDLRETLRAMVAAVTADGFTDREARQIIAGIFARQDSTGGEAL